MSLDCVMGVAPSRSSMCGPSDVLVNIEFGTVSTSLLYSVAYLEVISVPDFNSASIIRVAWHIPAIILLRCGKLQSVALKSSSNSESKHPPFSMIDFAKFRFDDGCITFSPSPDPGMAIVLSPALKADLWAMLSIPKASPETIVIE